MTPQWKQCQDFLASDHHPFGRLGWDENVALKGPDDPMRTMASRWTSAKEMWIRSTGPMSRLEYVLHHSTTARERRRERLSSRAAVVRLLNWRPEVSSSGCIGLFGNKKRRGWVRMRRPVWWPEPFVSTNQRGPGNAHNWSTIPLTHNFSIRNSSAAMVICQDIQYWIQSPQQRKHNILRPAQAWHPAGPLQGLYSCALSFLLLPGRSIIFHLLRIGGPRSCRYHW